MPDVSRAGVIESEPCRATRDDRRLVVDTIRRAFYNEPTVRWLFPEAETFERAARSFFGYLFDRRVEAGEVWWVPGVAVSTWEPPGGIVEGAVSPTGATAGRMPEPAMAKLVLYNEAVEARIPTADAWYLGVLAVHPDRQGEGFGRRLINPVRSRADLAGEPIALETAVAANVGLYEYLGFEVIDHFSVPSGGPEVWIMQRPPGAGTGW